MTRRLLILALALVALSLALPSCGRSPQPLRLRDESGAVMLTVELDGSIVDASGRELARVDDRRREVTLHATKDFSASTEKLVDEVERLRDRELQSCSQTIRECSELQRAREKNRHRIAVPAGAWIRTSGAPAEMWVESDGGARIEGRPFGRVEGLDGSRTQRIRLLAALLALSRAERPPANPVTGTPPELFLKLGCPSCHAKGAPHAAKIEEARGKPVGEVAAWILDAPSLLPGTQMPSFSDRLTDAQARALAEWVQAQLENPRTKPGTGIN